MQPGRLVLAAVLPFLIAGAASPAPPASPVRYPGWIDLELDPGNERLIGRPHVFAPVLQSEHSLLFTDLRGIFDDEARQDGEYGVGARHMFGPLVIGAYTFFDFTNSKRDEDYFQISPGIELYTENFEFRGNGHIPLNGSHAIGGSAYATPEILGNRVSVSSARQLHERALPGFDAEIGWRLPLPHASAWCPQTSLFAGGYWFHASGYETVAGPRGRIEASWALPFLPAGAAFTLGAEGNYDDVRSGQMTGIARLRIPLSGIGARDPLTPLQQRMIARIERLDTIVESRQDRFVEFAAFKGRVISNVVTIDATTADVPTSVAGAGIDSLVIADGGAGIIDTVATVVMPNGQTLASGGQILQISSPSTGILAPLLLPGAAATLNRLNAAGPVIQIGVDGTVDGLTLTGGNTGVFGNGALRAMVLNSVITNGDPNGIGIHLVGGSHGSMLMDNRITIFGDSIGGDHAGAYSEDSDDVEITGNTIDLAGVLTFGIGIVNGSGGLIARNSVTGGLGSFGGIFADAAPAIEIDENFVDVFEGIGVLLGNGSDGAQITDNEIFAGGGNLGGVVATSADLRISRNAIVTTGPDAPAIHVLGGANARILGNLLITGDEFSPGIELDNADDSLIERNIIAATGEESHGVDVFASDRVVVNDNVIATDGNNADGVQISGNDEEGAITDNDITTRGTNSFGIHLLQSASVLDSAPLVVSGNSISGFGDSTNRTLPAANADEFGGGIFVDTIAFAPAGVRINDNTITQRGFEADGIFINTEEVVMDGNTISTLGTNANGVFIFGITRNTIISNSDISTAGNGAAGVRFESSALADATGFRVDGNDITTTGDDAPGVRVVGSDSVVVSGNDISTDGNGSHGVALVDGLFGGSEDALIANNDLAVNGPNSDGVLISANSDSATVNANDFNFVTRFVINAAGAIGASGSGNAWSGQDPGATLCNGPVSVQIDFDNDGTGAAGSCP